MKLKNNLEARNLVQSNVDPCVFFGEGSVVLTHVGDEIIIGDTTKKIDKLIQALHGGNNKFDSTDKGSIDKYQGVEMKHRQRRAIMIVLQSSRGIFAAAAFILGSRAQTTLHRTLSNGVVA